LICIDDIFEGLGEAEKEQVIKHLSTFMTERKATCLIATSCENIAKRLQGKGRILRVHLGNVSEEAGL